MILRINEAILSILESKKQDGDVLPYATSIKVAHLLKMKAADVEKWAAPLFWQELREVL